VSAKFFDLVTQEYDDALQWLALGPERPLERHLINTIVDERLLRPASEYCRCWLQLVHTQVGLDECLGDGGN